MGGWHFSPAGLELDRSEANEFQGSSERSSGRNQDLGIVAAELTTEYSRLSR